MSTKLVSAGISLLMAGSLFLAACSSPTSTPAETLDANAVYTQAAETVAASIAQTDAAKPPATATSEVTPTFDPTIAAALTSVAGFTATAQASGGQPTVATTPLVGATTPAAGANTPAAQITPLIQPTTAGGTAAPVASSGDKAEWVSNLPADGTKIQKNASWDQKVVIKNTGTTTWDSKYAMKFFSGDRMGSPVDYYIVGEVKPGDSYTFTFPMQAPATAGNRQTNWVMQNGAGANFYGFFLQIEVTD